MIKSFITLYHALSINFYELFMMFIQHFLMGLTFAANCCFAESNKIPIEDFFRSPETLKVQISPNGESVIYGKSWEHRINIFMKKLETGEINQLTFSTNRDILDYFWADNDSIVYLQDNNGDEQFHLFAVSSKGGDVIDLTPFEGVTCRIVDKLENRGKILFAMNKRNKQLFDAYRLDTKSGVIELVAENPGDFTPCLVDHEGKIRVAGFTDGVNRGIRYRESENDDWKTIAAVILKKWQHHYCSRLIISKSMSHLMLVVINKPFLHDELSKGKEIECIFEDPNVDISSSAFATQPLIISRKRKKLIGCFYLTYKYEYKICDELYKKIKNFIDEKLSGYDNCIVSHDKEETKFVVRSRNDKTLGCYYLFDANKWELTKLFDCSPWLRESDMFSVKPVSYTSSDGLIIHGYLTLPKNQKCKNLPMVVMPHGGPWSRDVWQFLAPVQFLANRGYAVLQMNFRGSTGYGRKFLEAGYKQWGLKMQDDITDGVKWVCDQEIADLKKSQFLVRVMGDTPHCAVLPKLRIFILQQLIT